MWLAVDGGKVGAADDCAFPDHEEQQRKSGDDELGSRLAKPPVRYLLLLCAVMYALLTSPLFPGEATLPGQGSAGTTPLSGHFLSTLALVPMLRVLAICCRRPKASLLQTLCLAAQAAILYLAFRIRLSSL